MIAPLQLALACFMLCITGHKQDVKFMIPSALWLSIDLAIAIPFNFSNSLHGIIAVVASAVLLFALCLGVLYLVHLVMNIRND